MPIAASSINARTINAYEALNQLTLLKGGINSCTIDCHTINGTCTKQQITPPEPEAPKKGHVGGVFSQTYVRTISREQALWNLINSFRRSDDNQYIERVDKYNIDVHFYGEHSSVDTYITKKTESDSINVASITASANTVQPSITTDLVSVAAQVELARNISVSIDPATVTINNTSIQIDDIIVKRKLE